MFDNYSYILTGKDNQVAKKVANIPDADYFAASNLDNPNFYVIAARSDGLLKISKDGTWSKIFTEEKGNFGGYNAILSLGDGGAVVARNKLNYTLPDGSYPDKVFRIDASGNVIWSTIVPLRVDSITLADNLIVLGGDNSLSAKSALYQILDLENGSIVSQTSPDIPDYWYNFKNCTIINRVVHCIVQHTNINNTGEWESYLVKLSLETGKQLNTPVFMDKNIHSFTYLDNCFYGIREDKTEKTRLIVFDLDGNRKADYVLESKMQVASFVQFMKRGSNLYLHFWNLRPKKEKWMVREADSLFYFDTKTGKFTEESFDIPRFAYLGAGANIPASWFKN
ncbi:hypothetical protein HHJ78_04130 [Mobiluncus mulieris]|uniref:Arylsulfotransferase (ASST) n=2 Tax=Mobiluncus mulieris TaxID=2052 RepID=A0A7Y0U0J3_9ACTO|nr:hypothetical protein [Mobiluncus mulieris]